MTLRWGGGRRLCFSTILDLFVSQNQKCCVTNVVFLSNSVRGCFSHSLLSPSFVPYHRSSSEKFYRWRLCYIDSSFRLTFGRTTPPRFGSDYRFGVKNLFSVRRVVISEFFVWMCVTMFCIVSFVYFAFLTVYLKLKLLFNLNTASCVTLL